MKLCKSYRSTFEITNLAQKIQPDKESEPVMRHGEQPDILQFKDMEGEISGIADLISTFKKSDYQSLGKQKHKQNFLPKNSKPYVPKIFISFQTAALFS